MVAVHFPLGANDQTAMLKQSILFSTSQKKKTLKTISRLYACPAFQMSIHFLHEDRDILKFLINPLRLQGSDWYNLVTHFSLTALEGMTFNPAQPFHCSFLQSKSNLWSINCQQNRTCYFVGDGVAGGLANTCWNVLTWETVFFLATVTTELKLYSHIISTLLTQNSHADYLSD